VEELLEVVGRDLALLLEALDPVRVRRGRRGFRRGRACARVHRVRLLLLLLALAGRCRGRPRLARRLRLRARLPTRRRRGLLAGRRAARSALLVAGALGRVHRLRLRRRLCRGGPRRRGRALLPALALRLDPLAAALRLLDHGRRVLDDLATLRSALGGLGCLTLLELLLGERARRRHAL